jgi:DNA sulfur modification protein DndD
MFIRRLSLSNYGIFQNAEFNLETDVDHPIVLVTGNNGAGKTSILEALRVALHGRRAFDVPIGEAEYLRTMTNRFHLGDLSRDCQVKLDFDYVDVHKTRRVHLERTWSLRRQHVAESVRVTLDDEDLAVEEADDLLASIVPPEVARYFFFDGERIRELAEWEVEEESALFAAVSDMLGLGVLDQLGSDLLRLAAVEGKTKRNNRDASAVLADAERSFAEATRVLRDTKAQTRKLRGSFDRARAEVRRVGALRHDEIAALESELGELVAEKRALEEEAHRAAADILPLLCAKTLRKRFGKEIAARRRLEDRETVTSFLNEQSAKIVATLKTEGFRVADGRRALDVIGQIARGSLIPVNASLPSLSRSDAIWMQRVIERELPEMAKRCAVIVKRLRQLSSRVAQLEERKRHAPAVNDPAAERALQDFEECQRVFLEHEALIKTLEERAAAANELLESARDAAKAQRLEAFREGRLRVREQITSQILQALPALSTQLQASKEQRFGRYLGAALRELWHKTDRLVGVDVSFGNRRIALLDALGEIRKRDLSAGEKQLFAVAFIYALARLSGRLMPFVIDTPLGRLDQRHRQRFVAEFLPKASHQVILLSTDTEIVGPLYAELQPLVAHHHELAEYNGGLTMPVEVASA